MELFPGTWRPLAGTFIVTLPRSKQAEKLIPWETKETKWSHFPHRYSSLVSHYQIIKFNFTGKLKETQWQLWLCLCRRALYLRERLSNKLNQVSFVLLQDSKHKSINAAFIFNRFKYLIWWIILRLTAELHGEHKIYYWIREAILRIVLWPQAAGHVQVWSHFHTCRGFHEKVRKI